MNQQNKDYPFQLVGQVEFDKYTGAWSAALNNSGLENLNQYFNIIGQSKEWLNYVYFSVADILYLLSSVGTQYINLRFALIPTTAAGSATFSVILYGTDGNGTLTSSYFCAAIPDTSAPLHVDDGQGSDANSEVTIEAPEPAVYPLAAAWINNWNTAINNPGILPYSDLNNANPIADNPVEIQASLFDSVFGFLNGYRYPLKDLLLAIEWELNKGDEERQFRFVFGMHHYLKPGNTDLGNYDKLFGMVIHVNEAGSAILLSNKSAYYDISEPCPPYCH